MGNELFGVDIAGLIAQEIGPGVLDAQLIKVEPGTRNPSDPTAGTQPVETNHPCKGFIDKQKNNTRGGTLTQQDQKVVVLIGDTLPEGIIPESVDKISIEGQTFTITGEIDRDPAAATYTCPVQ